MGPRVGYRFELGERFHVTPWVSVRYLFGAENIDIDGRRFESDDIGVFPTVHLGWKF